LKTPSLAGERRVSGNQMCAIQRETGRKPRKEKKELGKGEKNKKKDPLKSLQGYRGGEKQNLLRRGETGSIKASKHE